MEDLNELQLIWNKQADDAPKLNSNELVSIAKQKIKLIRAKYLSTIGILCITALILSFYYLWIIDNKIINQMSGLGTMIFVIIIRIVLEIISVNKFNKIDFTGSLVTYSEALLLFYKFRKIVHFVITPIIYIAYFAGFISLLPFFKINLSAGFYLYIQISGIVFLVFFSFFVIKVIKDDLNNLKFLKSI
jgi:hypothetical protein